MRVRADGGLVRVHFVAAARGMLGEAQPRLREREPEGLVARVHCRLRHPQAVFRVVAVNVVGTHVYAPPIRGLGATQPANLGKLVTPERDWREKPPLMSDWRRRRGRRSQSKRPGPSVAGIVMPKGACGSGWPLDCQAGRDVYVRPPCRTPRHPGTSWSFTAPTCT